MTPQDNTNENQKFFLVREYYEYVRKDLSQEELQRLVALIAKDISQPDITTE
ncbi:MAG: hypothetical protein AB1Z19_00600 [Eubacteriales bacterium]